MSASTVQAAEHRARIARLRVDGRTDKHGKKLALWNYVLTAELSAGTQFLVSVPDNNCYAVLGTTSEVIRLPIKGADRWNAYFATQYGLAPMEEETRFIYEVLRAYVIQEGTKVELRRFVAYKHATPTAYMSMYNGQLAKIEGEAAISYHPNGEDGVFFVDDDPGTTCAPDIGPHGIFLDRLTNLNFAPHGLSRITPAQQRMALIVWMFALAFPDLMPTKPILLLEGTKGSGKTSAVVMLQLALTGVSQPMILQRNKEDDFGVVLLRSPIALFDNTDSYIDWVPDAICAYTTAGVWTKRRLYTDDESLTIRPYAFIAVATRNPASFRRDDVADRCVILRLERRPDFIGFDALKNAIIEDRPRLLGEYLWYIGRIVTELRAEAANGNPAVAETHRMADFAFMARIVGRVIGWTNAEVDDLLLALQGERDAFINEEDPLIDLLEKWLQYTQRGTSGNIGRHVTAFTLFAELETLAQAANIKWISSPRALTLALKSTHIERHFYIDTSTNLGAHKGFKIYRHAENFEVET